MIKKLKWKFVLLTMSILLFVFIILLGSLNIFTYESGKIQSRNILASIANHDGYSIRPASNTALQLKPSAIPTEFMNFFSVRLNPDGKMIELITQGNLQIDDKKLLQLISDITKKKNNFGRIETFHYYKQDKSYGKIIVFMDNSVESNLSNRLLLLSLIFGSICLFFLFFVSIYLSRFVIKPVAESFNKQKQFISDASHELKTPLSVISINAEVLKNEIGENKWLSYILSETHRMRKLVDQLLSIARMNDANRTLTISTFDLTDAIYEILLPFESTAFEKDIRYTYEIKENLMYTGEKESIKQMFAILIDNAIKYTNPCGKIHIHLFKNASKIQFEVINTGNGISLSEQSRIFERFYCSDTSRSREKGGYGLGLSIAKSIADAHHCKISVQSEPGEWTKFTVVF